MIILYTMILDEILFQKRQEATALKVHLDIKQTKKIIKRSKRPPDFLKIFSPKKITLIAEVKKASPSAGVIVHDYDPVAIARVYRRLGVKGVSVLTDEKFFQGRIGHLESIAKKVKLPVLRKDFILDEAQVYESRLAGAAAILLIVRILNEEQLQQLFHLTQALQMRALVEVHNEMELERALKLGAKLIGINNRDLDSLEISLSTTLRLLNNYPELQKRIVLAESGISQHKEIRLLQSKGVRGVLIGESLLRAPDLKAKIKELLG